LSVPVQESAWIFAPLVPQLLNRPDPPTASADSDIPCKNLRRLTEVVDVRMHNLLLGGLEVRAILSDCARIDKGFRRNVTFLQRKSALRSCVLTPRPPH
jgi:hypothetical protein